MKTAVMYGAGNIGRGFIGQVLHDSGYEVAFIDVNMPVVEALNERKAYTQLIVDENGTREVVIDNVRAVDGRVLDNVADEIANCEVMATSVGAKVLRFIAPNIAEGIRRRAAAGRAREQVGDRRAGHPHRLGQHGRTIGDDIGAAIGMTLIADQPVAPAAVAEVHRPR